MTRCKKPMSGLPALHAFGAESLQRRHRQHRRIHVVEGPLVCRHLAVRADVAFSEQQLDLILGEVDVHQRQCAAVEREVPLREPRVLPGVGHGNHVGRLHVAPAAIAALLAAVRRRKLVAILPARDVEVEVLLAPDHAGQRLAQDLHVLRIGFRQKVFIEHGGFRLAFGENHLALVERGDQRLARQRHADGDRVARLNVECVPRSEFRSGLGRVNRIVLAVDDEAMERVLHVG